MRDFVSELPFDAAQEHYLICGHTHSRVITNVAPNIHAINVGSDYELFKYYSISI
jgi:UDP-2,3-diacylglucosamine pyrophosphatase LpxH